MRISDCSSDVCSSDLAGEIITFTFPHVGNVGTNPEDIETITPAARGVVLRDDITEPSSWRNAQHFDAWLRSHNLVGLCGIDTRALTRRVRDLGAPHATIVHFRSEEHTSELQSLMRISYAVFCLKK